MSFNILTASLRQEENPWDERRAAVTKLVVSRTVDVLGVQEASVSRNWEGNDEDIPQWESLRRSLAKEGFGHALTGSDGKYKGCGKGRNCSADEEEQFGLHIFYNTKTLKPIGDGGTVNVDNDWCEWDDRAMVWQEFRTRTTPSVKFLAVNTHLDFEGISERGDFERCRTGQIKNILKALHTSVNPEGLPVVLTGDMNSYAFQKPIKTLLKAGFLDTAEADAPRKNASFNSFHGFKNPPPQVPGRRIDYIMVSEGVGVKSWELVVKTNPENGKFVGEIPSDHHPLAAVLTLPAPSVAEPTFIPNFWPCRVDLLIPLRWICF